jgi:hypothetical protein
MKKQCLKNRKQCLMNRKKERKKEIIPFTETETECLRIRAMDSERLQSSLWFCEIL